MRPILMNSELNNEIEFTDTFKKKYPKPSWATHQIVRAGGIVEDICKHGVGHPNKEWLKKHDPDGKKMMGVHGCDFCCEGDD